MLVGAVFVYCIKSDGEKAASVIWITCLCALPASSVFLAHCGSTGLAGITSQLSNRYVTNSLN